MNPLASLLAHPAVWRGDRLGGVSAPSLPTGFPALDAELPGGGWPVATLTELLPRQEGIGELRVLGPVLTALSAQQRYLVCITPPHLPYAPALQATGIDLSRFIIVKTRVLKQTLWAMEQALRSKACGAVLAWLERVSWPELRRLQLATEDSRTLALLFRPARAATESSPATLRVALETHADGLSARILKRRGAALDKPVLLHLNSIVGKRRSRHAVDRTQLPSPAPRVIPADIVQR